jgi:hypothetical protein
MPTQAKSTPDTTPSDLEESAAKLAKTAMVAGEVFIPGASELIAGNIGSGVGHFVVAALASAVLAPAMPLVATLAVIGVKVHSYAHATTGASLSDLAGRARRTG